MAVVSLQTELASRHSDFVDLETRAQSAGVPFIPVRSVNAPEVVERIASLKPDWLVVVGWSQICHAPLLSIPRLGAIGYHPSYLPELRGRAVLAWTILLARKVTAGSLFRLEPTVDSGDILAQQSFEIDARESLPTLLAKHMCALRDMWNDLLPQMQRGPVVGVPQDATRISFCGKRTAADGRIDWSAGVNSVDRLIRAVTAPYPGAFTHRGENRLLIWEAEPWRGPPHFGAPGQVLAVADEEVLIACQLGEALAVKRWSWSSQSPASPLRAADRLH